MRRKQKEVFLQTVTKQQQLSVRIESDITIDNYDLHLSSRNYILHLYTYKFNLPSLSGALHAIWILLFSMLFLSSRHPKETRILCKVIFFGEIDKNFTFFSVSTRRHGEGAKFFVCKISCFIRQWQWRRCWEKVFHSRGYFYTQMKFKWNKKSYFRKIEIENS